MRSDARRTRRDLAWGGRRRGRRGGRETRRTGGVSWYVAGTAIRTPTHGRASGFIARDDDDDDARTTSDDEAASSNKRSVSLFDATAFIAIFS